MSTPAALVMKDVLLIGLGAVGAIYSLILKRSDRAQVTVVARSNYEIVKKEGIHIQSLKYGNVPAWKPDRLFPSVSEALDRPYSFVVVATKALPEITPMPKLLAPLLSTSYQYKQPVYVLLQNGLNVEGALYQTLKALGKSDPEVIGSAVWIGTNLLSSNVVQHNDFDRLSIGLYKDGIGGNPAQTPREIEILEDFGCLLNAGGSEVTIVPEIQRVKFAKNFWNLAFASFATLVRHPLPSVFGDPKIEERVVPTIRAILSENLAVGRAIGFDESALPSSLVDDTIERTAKIHRRPDSRHRPSMLLDAENGRPIELEVIVGEVVRTARELNVDIPRIETIYALLIVVQNEILKKAAKH